MLKIKSFSQVTGPLLIGACSQVTDLASLASRPDPNADRLPDAASQLNWLEANPSQSLTITASWKDSIAGGVFTRNIQLFEDVSCLIPAKPLIRIPDPKEKIFQFEGEVGKVYAFKIVSFNEAGRFISSDCSPAIRIDDSAPLLTMTNPSLPGTMLASPSLSATRFQGVCSELGRPVQFKITDSTSKSLQESTICSAGSWTIDINIASLADGTLQTQTTHENQRKITATLNRNVSKDTVAPTLTLQTPVNGALIGSTNNTTTFPVTGLCSEPGQPVEIEVNGSSATGILGNICNGTLFNATIDVTPLASGTHSIRTVIRDAALNQTNSTTHSVTKSLDVPSVTIQVPTHLGFVNSANDSNTFAVSGLCSENGRAVNLVINGSAAPGEVPGTCSGGNFSASFSTTSLTQGTFTLKATTTSAAGNNGESSTLTLTKDTQAPTLAIGSPSHSSFVNISSNSASFAVSGTCNENSRSVELLVGGSAASGWSSATCTSGNWSGTFSTLGLASGSHNLTARITDAAGNSTTSSVVSITKDTVAPAAASTLGFAGGSFSSSTSLTAQWTRSAASDLASQSLEFFEGSTCNTSLGTDALSGSDSSLAKSGTHGKTYSFRVTSFDNAGNSSLSACSNAITVDTLAPTVAINSPTSGSYINQSSDSASFAVSGSCSEDGKSVQLQVNGSAAPSYSGGVCSSGSWSATFNSAGFAQGSVSLQATLSDDAGNSSLSSLITLTKDTLAPSAASSLAWAEGATSQSATINAQWSPSVSSDVDTQTAEQFANINCSGTPPTTVSLSKSDSTRSLSGSDGQSYTFRIRSTDAAGNSSVSSCSAAINVDTSFPSIAISNPANNSFLNGASTLSSVTISGSCSENGRSVTVLASALPLTPKSSVICTGGIFSGEYDASAWTDGSYSLMARISDTAGNTTDSPSVALIKDTVAPNAASSLTLASGSLDVNSSSLTAAWTPSNSSDLDSQIFRVFTTNNCSGTPSNQSVAKTLSSSVISGSDNTTYTFRVASLDAAGNLSESACSNATRVDLSAPSVAITSPSSGSFIHAASNSATFAVSGTCSENGRTVTLTANSSTAPSFVGGLCSSGSWSATFSTTGFSDGSIDLRATLSDAAGNTTNSSLVTLTKDTAAPTMAISTPTNNSNVGLAGSTTTYAVTGTCSENGRVVSLNVNGSSATGWTSPNCSGGGFSGTFNMASYSDGTLNLVARQSDLASNTGSSSSIALTKDTIAPTLALVTPANKSFINQSSDSAKFVVEGTCSENGATIRVLVNDTELAITDCQSGAYSTSVDTLDLMEAEHSFVAKAEDASGNISSSATHAVTKDMTPPTLSMVQPANSSFINIASNTTAFPVSGACSETGRSVSVLVNGSAAAGFAGGLCSGGLWSATVNVSGLADKPHTFAAELTDEAGNTTTTSDSNVTKDTSAPVVAVTTPSTNLGYVNLSTRGSVTISGSCSENSRVVRVELNSSGGGSAIIVNPTCTSNTWTTSQSFVGFGDGIVTASVSHVDAAGNSSSATRTWTLDATRPTVTLNQASWQRDTTVANWGFYELVFSENISGLTASDFVYPGTATIALGSLNLETTTPNTEFLAQVVVNASATGRMELQLPAGVVTDAAGNTNLAATSTDNAVTKVSEISSWQWLDTTSATEGINADTTTPAQDLFTFQSDGYSTLYATWMEEGDLKIRQLNGNYFSQPSWKAISTPQLPVAALNLESVGSDPEGTMVGMAYRSDDNNLWAIDIDLSGPSISYDFTHGTAKGGTPVTSFIMKYLNGGDTEIAVAGLRLDAEVSKLNLYSDFGSSTLEVESIYSNPPGTYAAFSGLAGALSQVTTTPYYLVAQGTRSADTDKNGNVSYLESNSVILYARTTVISDLIKDPYAVTGNTALTSNTTGSWVYGAWIERNASGKDIVHVVAHEVGKAPIFELTSTGLNKNLSYSAKDVSVAWVNNKLYAAWSELNASGFWQLRIAVWNGSTSSPAWSFIDGNSATLGANKSTSHSFSNVRLSVWADRLVVSGLQTDSSGVAQALIAIGW